MACSEGFTLGKIIQHSNLRGPLSEAGQFGSIKDTSVNSSGWVRAKSAGMVL